MKYNKLVLAIALAFALTGCIDEDATPSPTPPAPFEYTVAQVKADILVVEAMECELDEECLRVQAAALVVLNEKLAELEK